MRGPGRSAGEKRTMTDGGDPACRGSGKDGAVHRRPRRSSTSSEVGVATSQLILDPTKPPEELNGALLAGTCTVGAATGFGIYEFGKMIKGIVKDIEDSIK